MKKLLASLLLLTALLPAIPAEADVPGLQVNPLQYEDTLTSGSVRLGYIEVSNPSDTTITLESRVQGFRQKDNAGRLSFFDDPQISDGIKVDLAKFDLGSHEAIRVAFSVDPTKLPKGGVYAVIFFRTLPPAQSANSSYVAESANIGTLLLLQNGGPGVHVGQISHLNLPFWQFGNGITGTLDYRNTDRSTTAVGFKPALTARVFPWGSSPSLATGLVLPSSVRQFAVNRAGSFFGLLPVTLTDAESHQHRTGWVFAVTGWYQLLVIILLMTAIVLWIISRFTKSDLRSQPAMLVSRLAKLPQRTGREAMPETDSSTQASDQVTASGQGPETESERMPQPEAQTEPEPSLEPEPPLDSGTTLELKPANETTPVVDSVPADAAKKTVTLKPSLEPAAKPKTKPKRKSKSKPKTK